MAKIGLTKLGLEKQISPVTIKINNLDIEIKQYLPIQEKLELITRVLNQLFAINDKYINEGQMEVLFKLELLQTYSNINLTEKQKEDIVKTFDLLEMNGIFDMIIAALPTKEFDMLDNLLHTTAKHIYKYQNSARGILEIIQTDYNNMNMDLDEIQKKIKDPESLSVLKEIAPLIDLA